MALGYVRPARLDDVGEIARIQLTTWRVAYRRLMPGHVLDRLDEDWVTSQWREAVANPPTHKHRVFVAVEQTEKPAAATGQRPPAYLVGFAAAGPADAAALAPDEDHTSLGEGVAAITDLLVEPRWGRRGHGSRLLSACVDSWRSDGFRTAVAWTFAEDAITRRFLSDSGWDTDGTKRALDVDDMLVHQVRLHVSLVGVPETSEAPAVTVM
jgi:ribosomal protein S18 acetylase RimI-like enzyme